MTHVSPEEREARIQRALEKYQEDKMNECQEKGVPYTPNPINLVQLITAQVDAKIEEEEKPKVVAKKVEAVTKKK